MGKPVTWWMTLEEIFKAFIVRASSMFFSRFPYSKPSAAMLSTSF